MYHIEDDQDWDDTDAYIFARLEREAERDRRCGPCEDAHEVCAPYIGMLPDDTFSEKVSQLRF
jgi:hypothetical protein